MPILIRKLDRRAVLTMGELPQEVLNDMGRRDQRDTGSRRWQVGCVVADVNAAKSKFQRSVEKHVDDRDKRKSFATMVGALFDAVCHDDYQEFLSDGNVACKIAKQFKFDGHNHNLWELKYGKKDRLYFFPITNGQQRTIVLLMAFHKKDQRTPEEVDSCVADAKMLLRDRGELKYC
ncbi:hypothetical protein ACOTD7_19325 [Achromobacter xylosoxidans]